MTNQNSKIKKHINYIIDILIVTVVTLIPLIILPFIVGWGLFIPISFKFGYLFAYISSMVMIEVLPYTLVGLLQGTITALFIQNRRLTIVMLPSMFFFIFEVIIFSSIPVLSDLKGFLWLTIFNIVSWLALIISAFLSARWVLGRRTK